MGYDLDWHNAEGGTEEETYFRLNIWGMSTTLNVMFELGMVFNSPFPEKAEWRVAAAQDLAAGHDEDADESGPAVTSLLKRGHGEAPGIPEHKLASNDCWWVTPLEIQGALHRLNQHDDAEVAAVLAKHGDPDWWTRWVAYLNGAAEHGEGFRVG